MAAPKKKRTAARASTGGGSLPLASKAATLPAPAPAVVVANPPPKPSEPVVERTAAPVTEPAPEPEVEERHPVVLRGLTLLVGDGDGQRCLCEVDGHHFGKLTAAGWRQLHELSKDELRKVYDAKAIKLPPRGSEKLLGERVLAHALQPATSKE